jgi:hypothetical protein
MSKTCLDSSGIDHKPAVVLKSEYFLLTEYYMHKMAWLGMLFSLGALSGCGGSGDVPAPTTGASAVAVVDGAVIKGPVSGSQVCAYRLDGGVKGAQLPLSLASGATGTISGNCYVTPVDGSYRFALPSGPAADVMLEATGGTFCADETQVTGSTCTGGAAPLTLGTNVLSSVLSVPASGSATVYTTPLTTAALAAVGSGNLSASTFNASFVTLAGQVIGPNSGVTASTPPTVTQQPFLVQVSQFIQSGGSLSTAVTGLAQGKTTFQATPTGTTPSTTPSTTPGTTPGTVTAATLNNALAGTYNLVFHNEGAGCGSRCTYTDGQALTFTVQPSGALLLPNGTTLANPFHRVFGTTPNLAEIIWLDAAANVEYALTNNTTGNFSEINVGDAAKANQFGIPSLLGQLRRAAGTGTGTVILSALAGTYSKAYQYRGADAAWTGLTIGQDGGLTFNGGAGPTVAAADIVRVQNFSPVLRVQINRDLNANGIDVLDELVLHKDSTGALRSIEYNTGNTDSVPDDVGMRLTQSSVAALTHDGTLVPPTNRVTGTLGTDVLDFAVSFRSLSSLGGFVEASAGSGVAPFWSIQLVPGSNTPLQEGQVYNCRTSPSITIRINARTVQNGTLLTTDDNGGRCSITVTRLVTTGTTVNLIEGKFVAEFVSGSQASTPRQVINGVFRSALTVN